MKRFYAALSLCGVLFLAACGGNTGTLPPTPPGGTATAPLPATGGYPAQPTPTPLPPEGDYPAPAEPEPTEAPTAYPADKEVWILRPLGQQCADPQAYEFADLEAAVQALEQNGVEVLNSEVVNLPVCQACDCPTSEHFRAQIRAEDLAAAEDAGWFLE